MTGSFTCLALRLTKIFEAIRVSFCRRQCRHCFIRSLLYCIDAIDCEGFFGDEDPMGKLVRFNNSHHLKVTGVLKDVPRNSTLQFKYVVPFSYYEQNTPWVRNARNADYGYSAFPAYVKLKPGASFEKVSAKIKDIQKSNKELHGFLSDVILKPLKNWHLYNEYKNGKMVGGFIEYVRMFSIIGVLVLLIACINFINLTTARSEKERVK